MNRKPDLLLEQGRRPQYDKRKREARKPLLGGQSKWNAFARAMALVLAAEEHL